MLPFHLQCTRAIIMATPLADGGVHEMAAVVCLQYIVHRADVHCTLGDTGGG